MFQRVIVFTYTEHEYYVIPQKIKTNDNLHVCTK